MISKMGNLLDFIWLVSQNTLSHDEFLFDWGKFSILAHLREFWVEGFVSWLFLAFTFFSVISGNPLFCFETDGFQNTDKRFQ